MLIFATSFLNLFILEYSFCFTLLSKSFYLDNLPTELFIIGFVGRNIFFGSLFTSSNSIAFINRQNVIIAISFTD